MEDKLNQPVRIAVVYYSGSGHTRLQAEAVAQGAAQVRGTDVKTYTAAEAVAAMDLLDSADGIIFGTATYMGNISSDFKRFMEATVKKWFSRAWNGKVAGGFTNSSNLCGDKTNTLLGLFTFAMQHGMIWVGTNDLAGANEPDSERTLKGPSENALNRIGVSFGATAASFTLKVPEAPGEGDLQSARNYGARVAAITGCMKQGRAV